MTTEPTQEVKDTIVADQAVQAGSEPVVFEIGDILKKASTLNQRDGLVETAAKENADKQSDKKEEKKDEQQVQTTDKQSDKKEDKPKIEDPKIKHNAEHFKVVTEARDKAIAERDAILKERDELKQKFEAHAQTAQKLADYEKTHGELTKELETHRARIRELDLSQDPVFQEQYDKKIDSGMQEVFGYLIGAGVAKDEATALVKSWNLKGMSDVAADMDEITKGMMMSAIRETTRIDKERSAQLKKPEDFAAKRRVEMEQRQKQGMEQRQKDAYGLFNGLLEQTPELKGDNHKEFRESIQAHLDRAAKGEMAPREIFGHIIQAEALKMGLAGQHQALVDLTKERDDLKKKVDDLEAFVKNSNGTLKSEAGQTKDATEEELPSWQRLKVV